MGLLGTRRWPRVEVVLTGPDVRADPWAVYARLRRDAPVAVARGALGQPAWVLSRYDDVTAALRDPRLANDERAATGRRGLLDRWWLPRMVRTFQSAMVGQDGDRHRRLRNLVHQAFVPRRIDAMAPRINAVTDELLARAATAGDVDLIAALALPLPLRIISELMGVPEADRLRFHGWMSRLFTAGEALGLATIARLTPALLALDRFLRELIALRQREPGDDLTSALIQARDRDDKLSEDELTAMLFLLLLAGHETSINLISNGVLALLEHPAELARLRDQPGLAVTAVEEVLRYASPVEQPNARFAREGFVLHGRTIVRGDAVIPLIASANRDERVFARPDALDITREPNRHVAFGYGAHYCVGAPLARLEGQIALSAVAQRFPNLRLAVARSELRWRPSPVVHGLRALPVRLR
jgi:cytochrome P450 PksS